MMIFKEFFYMQKSDRKVLLLLLSVAAIALVVVFLVDSAPMSSEETTTDSTVVVRQEVSLKSEPTQYYNVGEMKSERFAFDPNTADSTQLLRLGLQPWQVRNIYKYRAAGGVYRKKEDFARLYGLTAKQYRELEPYIHISSDYRPASELFEKPAQQTPVEDSVQTPRYPVKLKEGETIDLSVADTTLLRRVPGIGSYYARRIRDYGERLGGYVNTEQLREIEDFPVEALGYFTLSNPSIKKLNVNQLSQSELRRHPYISYSQARAIVDYRRKHGRIDNLDQLRLLPDFTAEKIGRLRPYITY